MSFSSSFFRPLTFLEFFFLVIFVFNIHYTIIKHLFHQNWRVLKKLKKISFWRFLVFSPSFHPTSIFFLNFFFVIFVFNMFQTIRNSLAIKIGVKICMGKKCEKKSDVRGENAFLSSFHPP